MKPLVFLATVLAATIVLCDRTAGEQPRPSNWDEVQRGNQDGEKETERLVDRCQKMLDLQIAVYDGTRALNKVIEGHADKKPGPKDKQISVKLSKKQNAIVVEAT